MPTIEESDYATCSRSSMKEALATAGVPGQGMLPSQLQGKQAIKWLCQTRLWHWEKEEENKQAKG